MTATDGWRTDSAEIFRGGPGPYAPSFAGECAICGTVVRATDLPVEVVWTDGRPGVIHGAFDCLDSEQCAERFHGEAYGLEVDARCILPEQHNEAAAPAATEHLWGPPI
jgi:hypothetical protein